MKLGLTIDTEEEELSPSPRSMNLTISTEDETASFAKFTASGTYVVKDFLKVNSKGFQLNDETIVEESGRESKRVKSEGEHDDENSQSATPVRGKPRGGFGESAFDMPLAPSRAPQFFNRLEVKELTELESLSNLGQGSSGVVQLAKHKPTGTIVALKVVPVDLSEKKSKPLVTELRTLNDSKCAQIVSFHGAFYQDGALSLVLEYMDGGSLLDILKSSKRIPERYLRKITQEVLRGLTYLHNKQRIIHRDIKPSNILLNKRGEVKLADFGVSGKVGHDVDSKNSFVGTVTYMSPERIKGSLHSFDSDLWSVGLCLAECALGRFPYLTEQQERERGRNNFGFWDIMDKIVNRPPPAIPDSFSADFREFVCICLQKEPSKRLSAAQLLEHPFVKNCDVSVADLAIYFESALQKKETKKEIPEDEKLSIMKALSGGGMGFKGRKRASPS